jgi:dihydrofolate reductase
MRPLIVFSDVTLDGFMTGPDNDLGFMVDDPQLTEELTGELMAVADTQIWGRKSFQPSGAFWTTADGDLAAWMNATPKIVLSTNSEFDVSSWANATLAVGDGVDQVRRVKEADGGSLVVFGGVETVRSLVAADLVDEFWLKVNPVVVGHGGSMFSDVADARPLTLRSARAFPSGTVAAIYSNDVPG